MNIAERGCTHAEIASAPDSDIRILASVRHEKLAGGKAPRATCNHVGVFFVCLSCGEEKQIITLDMTPSMNKGTEAYRIRVYQWLLPIR